MNTREASNFGDGAGAIVMTRSENKNKGILHSQLHSEGKCQKNFLQLVQMQDHGSNFRRKYR